MLLWYHTSVVEGLGWSETKRIERMVYMFVLSLSLCVNVNVSSKKALDREIRATETSKVE